MLSSIHKYFSQNVIVIPFNIPLSMAAGYYIDGSRGMMIMTVLSVSDLVLKYNGFDSYYLSCSSMGNLAGKKVAANLISHYKCFKATETGREEIIGTDKIEVLDHLLPVSVSAVGVIAAYTMNKIEQAIIDYINDNNESNALIINQNDIAEVLEVG